MNTEQERADFEAWARKHGQPVFRDDGYPECYAYSNVQDNWEGWKARAVLQSQDREDAARLDFLIAEEATVEEMTTDRHGTHYRVRCRIGLVQPMRSHTATE